MGSLIGISGCGDEDQGSSLLIGVWSGSYVGVVDSGIIRMDYNLSSSSFRGTYVSHGRFGRDEGLVSGDWVEGTMVGVFESDAGCQTQFAATLDTINLRLTMTYVGYGDCADSGMIQTHKGEDVSGTWSGIYILPDETGGVQAVIVQTGTTFTGISRNMTQDVGDSGTVAGTVTGDGFTMSGQWSECTSTFNLALARQAEQLDGTMTMTAPCPTDQMTIKMTREHEGPYSIAGSWTGTLRDSNQTRVIILDLTQIGSAVSGTVEFPSTPADNGTISGTMNGNVFTGYPDGDECAPLVRMVLQSDQSRMIGWAKEPTTVNCEGGVQTIEFVRTAR